jgi:hypothetical protein
MSNAFAPIVRARPNPIFGRPVHQGSLPFDYSPILLLKPFGFRIAPDTLSSGIRRATGSRSVLAVSGFRLRARLDFSIPSCSPGQRGITPAFGYSAPHPSAEGTSTPMIHALPSAHYDPVRLPSGPSTYSMLKARPSTKTGLPRLPVLPFQRAMPITPVNQQGAHVDCFPVCAAFPAIRSGRRSHRNFRGVLRLYSRYSPLDCSAAHSGLCHEASIRPIARPNRSSATRSIDNSLGGSFLHW